MSLLILRFDGRRTSLAPGEPARPSNRQQEERLRRNALGAADARQLVNGLIQGVVRELKRSPMNTDTAFCAEIQVNLHRLLQIHVLILHEPARQAGADSNQRDVEPAALLGSLARREMAAHILEILAVTRITGEKPMKIGTQNCPSAPQGLVAIAQRAARPMLRRNQVEFRGAA